MACIDALFSKLNPAMRLLLASPLLHRPLSSALALITVTGRRSRQKYTIPVGYQRIGDQVVVLVSEARRKSWWRNYLDPGPVRIRLRDRNFEGQAKVVPATGERCLRYCDHTLSRMRPASAAPSGFATTPGVG
jgi:deazaflavin-dependent oxidoreductase (nitroreductase family)